MASISPILFLETISVDGSTSSDFIESLDKVGPVLSGAEGLTTNGRGRNFEVVLAKGDTRKL